MKRLVRLLGSLLFITLLFGTDNVHKSTAQTPPPISPRHEWREQMQNLAYYPDPAPLIENETNVLEPQAIPSDLIAWSFLTFQSFRDGNWEIYLSMADGGGQARLTANPAADIHPRLNRGCAHVVFASRRTGNYEIFSIKLADGSIKQLTFTPSDDVNPIWSPDGTKIAFQSYRDGQAEVYIMNADGSGQTRLTVDAGYDGEPAWSPDGAKIAFVSTRAGTTRAGTAHIWVMNSNGSGVIQLSTQRYSENPVWSPDGRQIAYDADGTGDGWQEIWLMNTDGSNQRQVFTPLEQQTDVWVGGWSPFDDYLAFTRISLIYYQENWYWTRAYLDAWDSNANYITRLNNQGTEWNPDWQLIDISPPAASIEPLAAYSRNGVTVRWTGEDDHSTTMKAYDVQYRQSESAEWLNWKMGTSATSADFESIPGRTYVFRVRATDWARNLGEWSQDDDSTTLYTWSVSGVMRDNRGIPQSQGVVTTTPAALVSFPSDEQGKYMAYVAEEAEVYRGMWGKPGYGELPLTVLDSPQDAQYNGILPPADNVVQDWGFESGNVEISEWMVSGVPTPSITRKTTHSGQFGAFFGQIIQSQKISETDNNADMPAIGIDASGLLHIAWVDIAATRRIAYTSCTQEGICQPVEMPFLGDSLALVVGTNGQVHLVWLQNDTQIMYATRLPTGIWSTPKLLGVATGWMAGIPKIALDPSNLPHVVWSQEATVYYTQKRNDGVWTAPEVLATYATEPDIAISTTGDVHVVWGAGGFEWMGHRMRPVGGNWSNTYNFDQLYLNRPPAIAIDSAGNAHIVWMHNLEQMMYIRRDVSGSWTTSQSLDHIAGDNPKVACTPDGHVVVSWTAGDQWITYRTIDGEWIEPRAIMSFKAGVGYTAMAAHPTSNKISVAAGGYVRADYYRTYADIFATTFGIPFEKTGHNSIKQTVNIPVDMLEPTLSFLYRHAGEDVSSADQFTVYLEGSDAITQSYSLSPTTEWTHTWLDVDDWAGQSVTVTFDLFTVDDKLLSWAYLDEVTLGSTYPDLWARGCAMNALPGEQAVCTLTYGNQGAATAEDGHLRVTLPENVEFEAAVPAPHYDSMLLHWIWDLGDIPAQSGPHTVVITTTVTPTATVFSTYTGTLSLFSATPELETDNNTATLEIFVGRRVYLPLTLRNK